MGPANRRRLVLAGIAASLVLLLAGSAVVQFHADHHWAEMQQHTRALEESWHTQRPRQPLWGEATSGSAFSHYERAMELAAELTSADQGELVQLLQCTDEQIATESAKLREGWQPVLAALRAGAHATDALPPVPPRGLVDRDLGKLLHCRWIASVAVLEARGLRHAGRGVEAVQLTLDAATFGADLVRRGVLVNQMIAAATLAISAPQAWPEPALAQLDAEALAVLVTGLERLDRAMPECLDQEGELLYLGNALQQVPVHAGYVASMGAWRYGFSDRWMVADAFLQTLATTRELANATYLAWPKRKAVIEREQQALIAAANPAAGLWAPNLVAAEQNLREVIGQVRMLRMSVAIHLGKQPPPLRDPLAEGLIRVRAADGEVRLQCEGAEQRPVLARIVRRPR